MREQARRGLQGHVEALTMAWHPCRFWQCVENYGGQCFGGGCRLNPAPDDTPDNTQTNDTEDKDNG